MIEGGDVEGAERVVFVLVSICHQKRFLIARRFTETYEQKIKYVGAKNMAQMLI